MKRLSEKEEAIMQSVWKLKKAFVKEVRDGLPDPKPHINTVATMMRRLADKGFLKFEDFGSTYRYAAIISKMEYTRKFVRPLLAGLFGNSMKNVVSFFAEEDEVSLDELKEIIKMIEDKNK
ncbi:BlaI/MecI/CopY family transcriptional regulator [Mucilaginibacter lappiensis]|uniref:Transcriptional regulator n=1 Tax=Mucilaginibacter lappiensis TaxID=354630 RepID=A0A1N6N9N7_9SPHI|nr:BlaI/MecI/CopY family transcriptional regulator [Mucilaginibacter lappiensis]MBB6108042.1 putative transcriptional regulator [Mucilaginibacter lappiensis]MBB6127865.1 putative transcriptional regulator [Mucilaginibacter lappiensis]SIP88776.1 Predicted transcriptional regulator [Mucilaginibacter lappiensis]